MNSISSRSTFGAAAARAPALLASVTSAAEARLAVAGAADIIDCKDPGRGALGALALAAIADIRRCVPRGVPVSATIGDLAPDPDVLAAAVAAVAATGVDYVKVGLFPGGAPRAAIARLGCLDLAGSRLVGVLLADRSPDLTLIGDMAAAGFAGVLVDTADKRAGALPDVWSRDRLAAFILAVRRAGMACGLAGSLRRTHIPALLQLGPDILGFRGALCIAGARAQSLDAAALAAIRSDIPHAGADDGTSRIPEAAQ